MTIKEKIEDAVLKYKRESGFSQDEDSFQDGADFAIKSVIEMLEKERDELMKRWSLNRAADIEHIINLLKSEI